MLEAYKAHNIANKTHTHTLDLLLSHIEYCANRGNFDTVFYLPDYPSYLSDSDLRELELLGYRVNVINGGDSYKISWE
jgi:hypothetical protein